MRTLGKPEGAARRAALGSITAGLMIALAACGTTVAGTGTGTGASGPASRAPAVGAAAQPSPSVNPGGVMIGAGPGTPRSWAASTALQQALSQHFNIRFPLGP